MDESKLSSVDLPLVERVVHDILTRQPHGGGVSYIVRSRLIHFWGGKSKIFNEIVDAKAWTMARILLFENIWP